MARSLRGLVGMAMVAGCVGFMGIAAGAAAASVSCSLYASPSGSDGGVGSLARPFATAQKLVDSLGPGQTGCLRQGSYNQYELRFNHGGSAGAALRLAGYPGETATVTGGDVYVPSGSNYVTIEDLHIDTVASGQVGVQLMATGGSLIGDDITNQSAPHACVILGSNVGWGQAVSTTIQGSVIHQCGSPADGNQDHAIYFDNAVGTVVTGDVIWGAAAYAIHLYQNAQNSQITHNVIVDNGWGVIFAGSTDHNSDGNAVRDNIIADSTAGPDVHAWWGGAVGTGNLAQHNCVYGAAAGIVDGAGFTDSGNVTADPRFVSPASHDYALQPGSPCLAIVGSDVAAALGAPTSTTSTITATTSTSTSTTVSATAMTSPATAAPGTTSTAVAAPGTTSTAAAAPATTSASAAPVRPANGPQPPPVTSRAPSATTSAPSAVTATAASLHGLASANGNVVRWYFQYRTTTRYGRATAAGSLRSATSVSVSARLTGLVPGCTYHVRLVLVGSDGRQHAGADVQFSTSPATARTARRSHGKRRARIARSRAQRRR